jgi:hypothetical protein
MTYGRIVEFRVDEQVQVRQSDIATSRRLRDDELCVIDGPGRRRWPGPLERLNGLLVQAGRLFGGGGGPMAPSPA